MSEILITSSALILAVILLRLFFRNKVSRGLIYGAWLLVALRLLIPGRGNRREESYGEHVRRRQKKPGAWDFLVWSGAVTVGISLIFLWLYYR